MNKTIIGDSLTELKKLDSGIVDMCITSPPYWGLRDYGTASWIGGNEDCDHKNAKEKSRYDYSLDNSPITKGSRTGTDAPRWKNTCPDCGATKEDKQLGLESTFQEYIDKLCTIFDEIKRVLKDEGTCWVNLGDTYGGSKTGNTETKKNPKLVTDTFTKIGGIEKCLLQIPSRFSIEMCNRGWILRNVIIWHKPSCMPSSVTDRFTVDFEYLFFFAKNKQYYFEQQFDDSVDPESYSGRRPRNKGTMANHDKKNYGFAGSIQEDGTLKSGQKWPKRNKRCVWSINPKPYKESHFACFPPKLIETPIRAGCPEGGIVLDPFMGSGTTAQVALSLKRQYLGIELNPEYLKLNKKRTTNCQIEMF